MKKSILLKISYLLVLALIFSCNGEDGETGPQGPQGEQGLQGPQGEPGVDGAANVHSYLFEDQSFIIGTGNIFSVPAITQEVLDYGAVLAYVRNSGSNSWISIPYYNGENYIFIHQISLGEISLRCSYGSSNVDFRFVVIEGSDGSASKSSMSVLDELMLAGVDTADFYQVADYYGLEY